MSFAATAWARKSFILRGGRRGAPGGVLPTRRLLTGRPEQTLAEIMVSRVVALPATATVLEACEFFAVPAVRAAGGRRRAAPGRVVDINLSPTR